MRFSILAAAGLLAAGATAAPTPEPAALNWDDVLVFMDDGSTKVMKASKWAEIERRAPLPPVPESFSTDPVPRAPDTITRRDCEQSTEAQILTDENFLGADVAVSPVLSSYGGISDVSVASGYSIQNTVTVQVSSDVTLVEKVLSINLGVSYAYSWTTTETTTVRFTMGPSNYGLVVSQPNVRRVTGNMLSGCTDSPRVTPFVSDTYTSQSYGHLNWVKGVIRLCNSTTYPVPYCSGEGMHY
ncbi:hypothetical protein CGRA01v4_14915 [Colletotrichum graminicola]|uniref:Celp0028 effector like protein n=1 Tax=Colletotrichum graminicola (strain M1.001 / M2 / FGSC 10212) TaxID=645133 RepID=E3QFJ2_COLGM|nr:uncharacterized protein GLRG_04774 [Colletotrichum graminicola M1.001]EFQ29630.1 hypothetical protein GLRG_04774 [Colletotrichum graminicola M1.001]WDK23623.1 hypothetical protein CGRA01v4_14915 [Colletotrichum graminicola]